jgi:hypothetical protein
MTSTAPLVWAGPVVIPALPVMVVAAVTATP